LETDPIAKSILAAIFNGGRRASDSYLADISFLIAMQLGGGKLGSSRDVDFISWPQICFLRLRRSAIARKKKSDLGCQSVRQRRRRRRRRKKKEEDGPEKKEARNGNSCMNAEQEQKRYQIGKRQTLRNRTV
jgi:hypothetical protein